MKNVLTNRWRVLALVTLFLSILTLGACKADSAKSTTADEPAQTGETVEFTLEAYLSGYKGVGGDIDGQTNPELKVNAGDTVKVTLINKENMAHDIALENAGTKSEALMKVNERTTFTFEAKANDTYFCSLPGHRQAGMVGKVVVGGGDQPVAAHEGHSNSLMPATATSLKKAKKVNTDEIGWDAADIPPPIKRKENKTVEYVIETEEVVAELEDGTTYEMWTYNGKVPGPFLRVKEGDTVIVHVDNAPDSTMSHSIDFHSVTGPGGGAAVLQVPPGERRSLQFKATHAGLYVYHCATPHIPTHLARGMFGMILVEPKEGLAPVDKEFYVMQGEYYTKARPGTAGHQEESSDRLFEEMPTYVVFNGRVGSLTGERVMKAEVGENVRIFFGVGGPNTHSAFHVIGEIFDKVYSEAAIISEPLRNVQTTAVPPGGATMVEFEVDYPGKYLLVDHALTRLDKGAVGILEVTGEADDTLYKSLSGEEATDKH
ncbi:nitrite reductase, copper-containing [Persicimonas caeni]|uniref:Copper-containing nitrite reductase n=2 Tax=Persicimonas caeni TaxID=2292766 RepID=A0A4Y6Q318_PERCE|nr:nitrite reductase, copper-containing [Persicimonas caeni]QED36062.1 nitrite reductase, copper-containing [Persicimonas caeni]